MEDEIIDLHNHAGKHECKKLIPADLIPKATMRESFERWVRRSWEKSWGKCLRRNARGAYENWEVQQAWFAWAAGWRSRGVRSIRGHK